MKACAFPYVLKPLESVINVRKLSLLIDHLCSALMLSSLLKKVCQD